MHSKIHRIIQEWFWDIFPPDGDCHPVVSFEVYGRNIYIYSDKPGLLIGYHGRLIDNLNEKLVQNGVHKKVHLIELGDGMHVREIKLKRRWL